MLYIFLFPAIVNGIGSIHYYILLSISQEKLQL